MHLGSTKLGTEELLLLLAGTGLPEQYTTQTVLEISRHLAKADYT